MPVFDALSESNRWLEERCIALWAETAHQTLSGTIAGARAAGSPALMPGSTAFEGENVEQNKRVSSACLITLEHDRYSVHACFASRPVSLHICPERRVIVADGRARRPRYV